MNRRSVHRAAPKVSMIASRTNRAVSGERLNEMEGSFGISPLLLFDEDGMPTEELSNSVLMN
jgi:hypothetical protein